MGSAIQKLLSISSGSICHLPCGWTLDSPDWPGVDALRSLLDARNGFFAFEGALMVRPTQSTGGVLGLAEWNAPETWRNEYEGMADEALFFAEDVFGGQFCIRRDGVCSFEPESGQFDVMAADLEGWAQAILDDYDVLTGASLAHEWQVSNGPLPPGIRLLPKKPFIVGGEFAVDNLYCLDAAEGMRFRGHLATQVRDLPDGAPIQFEVVKC